MCNDYTNDITNYINNIEYTTYNNNFIKEIDNLLSKSNSSILIWEYQHNRRENTSDKYFNEDELIAKTIIHFRKLGYYVEYKKIYIENIIEIVKNNFVDKRIYHKFNYSILLDFNPSLWKRLLMILYKK